jgi:small-conductance mechanosensitive channel
MNFQEPVEFSIMINQVLNNIQEFLELQLFKIQNSTVTISDIVIVIIILLATRLIIHVLSRVFKKRISGQRFDMGRTHAVIQIVKYALWITAIVIALDTINVEITFLLAGSAALLVGVGLGLQQIFQDILSGIALLFEGSLKVGDIVEIEDEVIGKVKEIGLRTSKIETRANIIMIIPNSKFITDNVINWSHLEKKTRFSVSVGVAYGSDVELVRDILLQCAKAHKDITKTPKPFVRFTDFGNSSLDFELFFWTTNTFWVENIKSDLRFQINRAFVENNIRIPFPQRDIHIIDMPEKT